MKLRILSASALATVLTLSLVGIANAQSTLSVSCSGTPTATAITWTAASTGGVAPIAYLWGNGSTSTTQTVSYAPGTYSVTIQATDASSTVATSSCSATVPTTALPMISSFIAPPSSITVGQSSVLSWSVGNASSTSVDNGVGTVGGTSVTVSPTTTTTYTLTAANPAGTTTDQAIVVVNAPSTSSTLQAQIQALLNQIAQLKQQIAQLVAGAMGGTTTPPIVPPGQLGNAACISLSRDVSEGDRGDDVRSIQEMLAENPAYGFTASTTGYFGPMTARAMMRFQEMNGIASSSTGYVGPLTRGFFEHSCGKGLEQSNDSATATSSEDQQSSNQQPPSTASTTSDQRGNSDNAHGNGEGNGNGNGHGDN